MNEEWKPIPILPGYEATAQGDIRSVRVLKGNLQKGKPYQVVTLTDPQGKYRPYGVHRLVLMAFVGPCPEGKEACHRNGDGSDNRLENLYWGTHAENCADMVIHGTHRSARKTQCKRGHEFTDENTYIRPNGGRNCLACKRLQESEAYYDGRRPQKERELRGQSNTRKTHCPKNHPLSGDNLYEYKGTRSCKICRRDKSREQKRK